MVRVLEQGFLALAREKAAAIVYPVAVLFFVKRNDVLPEIGGHNAAPGAAYKNTVVEISQRKMVANRVDDVRDVQDR